MLFTSILIIYNYINNLKRKIHANENALTAAHIRHHTIILASSQTNRFYLFTKPWLWLLVNILEKVKYIQEIRLGKILNQMRILLNDKRYRSSAANTSWRQNQITKAARMLTCLLSNLIAPNITRPWTL